MDSRFALLRDDGTLRFSLHAGQTRAWESDKRFVAVIAGTRAGKTIFGPVWLHREIMTCGPGNYLIATPTYPILNRGALPYFQWLFEQILGLGTYKSDNVFVVSPEGEVKLFGEQQTEPTQIFFGHAQNPDSLEAATIKAAWLDEVGMSSFKLGSWEAVQRRVSIDQGRILITTTLYNLGWLVQKIWKPWQAGLLTDTEVIRFESIENPVFPRAEWEKQKRDLPRWKFDLQFRAIPTRPAGLIYENFDEDQQTRTRFKIPDDWSRYIGLDFGGVNTAALYYAKRPGEKTLYLYREYKAGHRTAEQHVRAILEGEPMPRLCVGGSKSEDQWRQEFRAAGLMIEGPDISDVEVGLDRVFGFHARQEVIVFDDLEGYLEEKATYARKLDDMGQPTEMIEDKNSFHFMDAERYILGALSPVEFVIVDEVLDPDEVGMFAL